MLLSRMWKFKNITSILATSYLKQLNLIIQKMCVTILVYYIFKFYIMRFVDFSTLEESDKWKVENGKMIIPNDSVKSIIDLANKSWDFGMIYWDSDINFEAFWIEKDDFYKYLDELINELDEITWTVIIEGANKEKTIYSRFISDISYRLGLWVWRFKWNIVKWKLDDKVDTLQEQLNWVKPSFDNFYFLVLLSDFLIDIIHLKSKFETKEWDSISEKLDRRISIIIRDIVWDNKRMPPKEYYDYQEDFKNNKTFIPEISWDEDDKKIFGFFLNLAYNNINSNSIDTLSKYREYFQWKIDQNKITDLIKGIKLSEGSENALSFEDMFLDIPSIVLQNLWKDIPEWWSYNVYINGKLELEWQTKDSIDIPFLGWVKPWTKIKVDFLDYKWNSEFIDESEINKDLSLV